VQTPLSSFPISLEATEYADLQSAKSAVKLFSKSLVGLAPKFLRAQSLRRISDKARVPPRESADANFPLCRYREWERFAGR
jgi:hypothetical protein